MKTTPHIIWWTRDKLNREPWSAWLSFQFTWCLIGYHDLMTLPLHFMRCINSLPIFFLHLTSVSFSKIYGHPIQIAPRNPRWKKNSLNIKRWLPQSFLHPIATFDPVLVYRRMDCLNNCDISLLVFPLTPTSSICLITVFLSCFWDQPHPVTTLSRGAYFLIFVNLCLGTLSPITGLSKAIVLSLICSFSS